MCFYRICNRSNRVLIAKTGALPRTVHVLLSVICHSQVETIVQMFADVGVEPYATFVVRKTKLFLRMPHSPG